jgi:hypothetical protein
VKIGESRVIDVRKKVNMQRNTLMNRTEPLANINDWIKDIDPKNISFTLSRRIPQHDGSFYLTESAWF